MGKVMVVTGASRGIGAAVARRAAEDGWDVAVNYRGSREAADALAEELRNGGHRAFAVQADMASDDDVKRLFAEVDRELGPVDALINNAGVNHMAPITEFDQDAFDHVFGVNVRGVMAATREAVRRMVGRGGVIINVSSVSARTGGGPHGTLYAATKGALDAFTIGLAKEVVAEGIRVCGVRPGMTETDIFDGNLGLERARERAAAKVPMERMGTTAEIAAMVVWLCSDEASYVTGTNIDIAGGL